MLNDNWGRLVILVTTIVFVAFFFRLHIIITASPMECWDVEDIWKDNQAGFSPITIYLTTYVLLFFWAALEVIYSICVCKNFGSLITSICTFFVMVCLIAKILMFSSYVDYWQGLEDSEFFGYDIKKTYRVQRPAHKGPMIMSYREYLREGWCQNNISIGSMNSAQEESIIEEYEAYQIRTMGEFYQGME